MSAQIKPGHTYRVTNSKSRTVLDLSMADFKSVAAASWDNSDNQKVSLRCGVAEAPKTSADDCRIRSYLYSGSQKELGPPHNLARHGGRSAVSRRVFTSVWTAHHALQGTSSPRGSRRSGTSDLTGRIHPHFGMPVPNTLSTCEIGRTDANAALPYQTRA